MRRLTPGEIKLLREAFGDRLPYDHVRLRLGHGGNPAAMAAFRNGNTAITLRRSIYFRIHYSDDFSLADPSSQSLFLHEMTHIWQYAVLGVPRFLARYARELAACRFSPRAMYRYEEGVTRFAGARLEAQAQMVGDYCLRRLQGVPRTATGGLAQNLKGRRLFTTGFSRRPAPADPPGPLDTVNDRPPASPEVAWSQSAPLDLIRALAMAPSSVAGPRSDDPVGHAPYRH